MHKPRVNPRVPHRRRGAVAIFTVAMLVVLLGFASLTIDVGYLYGIRLDLQNSVDAAALSGASALGGDEMLKVRVGSDGSIEVVADSLYDRAKTIAYEHSSLGASGTVIKPSEVLFGWIDLSSGTSALQTGGPPAEFNAVRVTAARSQETSNGPVEFFFASVFGKQLSEVSASATAAFDDRVGGFEPDGGAADLWPLSMSDDAYEGAIQAGADAYDYDGATENIYSGSDGLPEANMYPDTVAPGNFGLLNIGVGNQGVPAIADHIENGVPPEHVENEIGTTAMTFFDSTGAPVTYSITGNPGLKASLENALKSQIGKVVAIPIHDADGVTGGGANAVYPITGVRFVRVMDAKLKGSATSRGVWVQPVSYGGPGVIINSAAPSSQGNGGRLVLVR